MSCSFLNVFIGGHIRRMPWPQGMSHCKYEERHPSAFLLNDSSHGKKSIVLGSPAFDPF
jgi:hypothetical protein